MDKSTKYIWQVNKGCVFEIPLEKKDWSELDK